MCFGGLALLGDSGSSSHSSTTTKKKPKPKPKKKPKKKASAKKTLATLEAPAVRARLESEGWTILGTPSTLSNASYSSTVFTIIKGSAGGAVGLYEYADRSSAEMLEDQFKKNPNAAVARDNKKVLSVILPNRRPEADKLLEKLLR
jgi:hypothetical protein